MPRSEGADGVGDGLGDLSGEGAAVRVAEDEPVGARVGGGLQDGQRVVPVRAVAVEEVLRVDDDLAAVRLQERDRVARPSPGSPRASSAAPRRRGSPRPSRRAATVGVSASSSSRRPASSSARDARVAGAAERAHACPLQAFLAHRDEELRVLRVRARPAALDVVDAELVQLPRDRELVVERQRDAGALAAVAERGVVDRDAIGHRRPVRQPTCRPRVNQAASHQRKGDSAGGDLLQG